MAMAKKVAKTKKAAAPAKKAAAPKAAKRPGTGRAAAAKTADQAGAPWWKQFLPK